MELEKMEKWNIRKNGNFGKSWKKATDNEAVRH